MVATTPSVIALTPPARTMEVTASAAVSPGHVAELHTSTGEKVRANTRAAGSNAPKLVVLEKEYLGKGISDAYASADTTILGVFRSGDMVTLRVAASATAVPYGGVVELVSGGTVAIVTAGEIFAVALEAVDNSGGGSEAFIRCMIA